MPLRQQTDQQKKMESSSGKPIVIVPDKQTFLYYLSTWTVSDRFPIFVGMDEYVKKFARVYNDGDNHYVIAERKKMPAISETLIYRVLLSSFTAGDLFDAPDEVTRADLRGYFKSASIEPEGIVLTSINSPELLGGVALASYHKQALDFYKPPKAPLLGTYSQEDKESIRISFMDMIDKWGYEYRGLGKGIDFITIALSMPFKYDHGFSLDDAINREKPDSIIPYAYTGRLMDLGKGLAVYQAMCSVFLDTNSAIFFDRWPENWGRSLKLGCYELRKKIPAVNVLPSDFKKWRSVIGDLNTYDFVFINAAGYPHEWSGGTLDDIPDTLPVAVNFSHSSSANDPTNPNTIAGRWLINGAFAYYGSVSEPYSDSFNVSYNIVRGLLDGMPFAHATADKSKLPVNRAKPWKLIFVGDPLFRPSFRVKPEDEEFFEVMSKSIENMEQLRFGNAQNILERYLNVSKSEVETDLTYLQAEEYLKKLYQLTVCESLFGGELQKRYSSEFIISWMSDYPTVVPLRRQMYDNEIRVKDIYMAKYEQLQSSLVKKSFLEQIWRDIRYSLRERLTFIPRWHVIHSVPSEGFSAQEAIGSIMDSDFERLFYIGEKSYSWKKYVKDQLSNFLEFSPPSSHSEGQLCIAVGTVTATKDCEAFLRIYSNCAADLYLNENQIISLYTDDKLYKLISQQVTFEQGTHKVIVIFRPGKKRPVKIGVRITDSNYYSVEDMRYDTPIEN